MVVFRSETPKTHNGKSPTDEQIEYRIAEDPDKVIHIEQGFVWFRNMVLRKSVKKYLEHFGVGEADINGKKMKRFYE